MTFANRAILVGLLALGIPLAIHLLGRRRARKVILPTARFAEGVHASSRGRLWLKRVGPVSYTHLRAPRDRTRSRMPSSA